MECPDGQKLFKNLIQIIQNDYDYGKDVQLSLRNIADIGNNPYLCSGLLNSSDMVETFEPTKIIKPDLGSVPETGNIGYVKFENPHEYVGLCKPQWGEVDLRTGEVVR